jgi:dTDP-4-amino-4,6-dideoxygalactose transaminase
VEVDNRDKLQQLLLDSGIETRIHYPILISEQAAFKKKQPKKLALPRAAYQTKRILSLPIHQNLDEEQVMFVVQTLKENT